jgi:hypothetical protein
MAPPPTFTLYVTFSGICAFVPIANPTPKKRTFVIMPGLEGAGNALDDEPLCPHDCYLRSPVELYKGVYQVPLKGKRVTFKLQHAHKADVTDLPKEAIDMKALFGSYCVLDPGIFRRKSPPRPSFVMTQVILPAGKFDRSPAAPWSIDAVVGGGGQPMAGATVAHEVIFSVNNLVKASLRFKSLDGSQVNLDGWPQTQQLDFDASNNRLRIENTCKDLELLGPSQNPRRDRDFKWYYELLDEGIKRKIKDALGSGDLPIPRTPGFHVAGDHDCFPARVGYHSDVAVGGKGGSGSAKDHAKILKKKGSTEG